jgi:hypothetical protein
MEQQLTLKLNLILYNQSLALVVNLGGKFGRDSMVSSGILDDETFVTLHARVDSGLLYGPLSNVRPVFLTLWILLLRVRDFPSRLPVISELFEEGGFERGGLLEVLAGDDGGERRIELLGEAPSILKRIDWQ